MGGARALASIEPRTRPADGLEQRIVELLADFSIEITPASAEKHASLAALLPPGTRVYVALVPGDDYRRVVATAARLAAEGLVPVPHIPARSVRDRNELTDYLARATGEAGVEEALVIGGGIDRPAGAFSGTIALLETGLLERHGIRAIGLAGHPEGERRLELPGVAASLDDKLAYARSSSAKCHLVTQFVFEAGPVLAWERAIRAHGSTLPIHVGIPGPATIKSLLRYARLCGVGNSMRVLTRQGGSLLKLASLSYPDALVTALAEQRAADSASRIARLHFYPFGGLARTTRWIEAVRQGAFTLHADRRGFTVDDRLD